MFLIVSNFNSMKKIIYSLLCILSLTSCESFFVKDVKVEVEDYPPGLALIANWDYPDLINQEVSAFVSTAKPILGEDPTLVVSPDVTIQSKSDSWVMKKDNANWRYFYQLPMSPKVGDEIILKVKSPGFEDLESRQIILDSVPIKKIEIVENGFTNIDGYKEDLIKVNIDDPVAQNYYKIELYIVDTSNQNVYPLSARKWSALGEQDEEYPSELTFTDELFNGKNFNLTMISNIYFANGFLLVRLSNISQDQYLYLSSKNKSNNAQNNPFSEPVNIHQNVKNGYGIFSISTVTFGSIPI